MKIIEGSSTNVGALMSASAKEHMVVLIIACPGEEVASKFVERFKEGEVAIAAARHRTGHLMVDAVPVDVTPHESPTKS